MIEAINSGSALLEKAGADPRLTHLVADLHNGSWITVGTGVVTGETEVIEGKLGSRQGCVLGAIIFNITYEHALRKVRKRAAEEGIPVQVS